MIHKFAAPSILIICLVARICGAQTIPAPPQAKSAEPELVIDVKLLEIDRLGLNNPGNTPANPAAVSRFNPSYVISIPDSVARSLADAPRTKVLHSVQLTTANEKTAQVHIGSRVPATTVQGEFLDVGFDFDITTRKGPNRETLRVGAQVQIRRGNNTAGDLAQPLFKSLPIQHEVGIVDGETIIIGGFITDTEALVLTDVPALKSSALLNYLFSGQSQQPNVAEVALMLVPHLGRATGVTTAVRPGRVPETSSSTNAADRIPPPVTPKAAPEPVRGLYTVQVGAFQSLPTAQALLGKLEARHNDVYIETIAGEPPLYRVRVGRVPDLTTARQLETQLRREGYRPVVAAME